MSATVFNVKKVGIDTMVRGEHLSMGDRESRDSDSRGSRDSDGKKAAATVASDGKLEQAKEAADFFKHNKVLLRLLPLLAPRFLLWRVRLYSALCHCYEAAGMVAAAAKAVSPHAAAATTTKKKTPRRHHRHEERERLARARLRVA